MSEMLNNPMRMLLLIAAPKLEEKAVKVLEESGVPLQHRMDGHGTASREILDMLGIDSGDKALLMSVLPKSFADEMLVKLRRSLRLGTAGSGIACTLPLTGASKRMVQMLTTVNEERRSAQARRLPIMETNAYQMVIALVNQGYSEDVMAAARPAGAGGGTVLHSRRVGSDETLTFWGISVQPEKEIVMILCRQENKSAIMKAVADSCGMKTEAQGLVLSLPVETVVGIDD